MVVYTTTVAVIGQSQKNRKQDWTITDTEVVLGIKKRLHSKNVAALV